MTNASIPTRNIYDPHRHRQAYRNIVVAAFNAVCTRFHLVGQGEAWRLKLADDRFPSSLAFPLTTPFLGVVRVQRSIDDVLTMRTNVFEISDLSWQHDDPTFDVHRPIASCESRFDARNFRWIGGWSESLARIFRPTRLETLARLVVRPNGFPDLIVDSD